MLHKFRVYWHSESDGNLGVLWFSDHPQLNLGSDVINSKGIPQLIFSVEKKIIE